MISFLSSGAGLIKYTVCIWHDTVCVAWRVCDWWVSMCSRRGCMAECDEIDVWGMEECFGAACGSASYVGQVVCKLSNKWGRRDSQVSRDMEDESYALWQVYRAAVGRVYESCGGARVLYPRRTCVSGVLWDAIITSGNVPRRGRTSRRERNVKVGQVQGRHELVQDQRGGSAIRRMGVMVHHYGRRTWSIGGHLVNW